MEGADTDRFSRIALKLLGYPLFHLPGCLVSESNSIDMARLNTCFVDQMSNFMGDYRGFSAARAS